MPYLLQFLYEQFSNLIIKAKFVGLSKFQKSYKPSFSLILFYIQKGLLSYLSCQFLNAKSIDLYLSQKFLTPWQIYKRSCTYFKQLIDFLFINFLDRQFTMHLVIFLTLILTIYSQYTISTCLYTQRFKFLSNTSTSSPPGLYTMTLPWRSPQTFTNASITLTGYRIIVASAVLRYDVWLSSTTSVDTQINLQIYAGTQIAAISFQIILIKPCSGTILLQDITLIPTVLSVAGRSTHAQNVTVYMNFTFGSNLNIYLSDVFMISLNCQSAVNASFQQFKVTNQAIVAGLNYQRVQAFSDRNIITQFRFTHIMIDLSTIPNLAYYYNPMNVLPSQSTTIYNNLQIPSVFNPYASEKCIISLQWVSTSAVSGNPTQIDIVDTGTLFISNFSLFIYIRIMRLTYSRLCIQDCPITTFVNYTASKTACVQYIPYCQNLTSNVSCAQCIMGYFLYQNHSKCSLTCLARQYGNTSTYMCENCVYECLFCTNDSSCQRCRIGFYAKGGCTTIVGCIEISYYLNYQCVVCRASLNYQLSNGICICQSGFKQVTQMCTDLVGCITAVQQNYQPYCYFCNSVGHFLAINGVCICKSGYYLDENDTCSQICGDGILLTLPCDDGNNDDGDGCSSSCSVEKFYKCVNGSTSRPSVCTYLRKDISLSVSRIDRVNLDNTGIFTFKLLPALINYKKINLVSSISFQCSQSISVNSTILQGNYLIVYVVFFEDLQTNQANFSISLNSFYFAQNNASLRFNMISNGVKLILSKNFSRLNMLEEVINILAIIIMSLFFLSFFLHKMIGIEMINSFQVVYLVHLINPSYTAPYSLVKLISPTVFSFVYFSNNKSNIYQPKQHIVFSKNDEQYTIFIINGISIGIMSVFVVMKIITLLLQGDNQHSGTNRKLSSHMRRFHAFTKSFYKCIIYPFFISTFLVTMLLLKRQRQLIETSKSYSIMSISQCILTSFVFYYEQKALFISRQINNRGFMGLSRCHYQYLSIYITFLLVVTVIFKHAYLFEGSRYNAELLLLLCYLVYVAFMIFYSPYQANVHNIGLVANLLVAIYFIMWSTLKKCQVIDQTEQTQIFVLSIFILLVIASLITTIIRIIHQCKLKWHQICDKKQQKEHTIQQEKQENICKNPNCKSLLHEQQIFMAKIQRNVVKRYNEIQTSLFAPIKMNNIDFQAQQALKKDIKSKYRKKYKEQNKQLRDEFF